MRKVKYIRFGFKKLEAAISELGNCRTKIQIFLQLCIWKIKRDFVFTRGHNAKNNKDDSTSASDVKAAVQFTNFELDKKFIKSKKTDIFIISVLN